MMMDLVARPKVKPKSQLLRNKKREKFISLWNCTSLYVLALLLIKER